MRQHLTVFAIAAALSAGVAFAQPMPGPKLPMPTMAGGTCGIVKQVPMPAAGAQLLYWRCTDGREVYFHVRKGWMPDTQDATDPNAVRAELLGLHARAQADKVDALLRREVLRAVAKARAETA